MSNVRYTVLMALVAVLLINSAHAGAGRVITNSTAAVSVQAYASGFIPESIISNSVFLNTTYGGKNYTIMTVNNTSLNYILFNTTVRSSPVFLTAQGTIYAVLRPYLLGKFMPNQTSLAAVNSLMASYQSSGQGPLNDCLFSTGLTVNMCSLPNENVTVCVQNSCQHAYACNKVMGGTGGVTGTFAVGILNFSKNYTRLNNTYNDYFSLYKNINQDNIGGNLQQMSYLASNISIFSKTIFLNPIMQPPVNVTPTQAAQICANYAAGGGPWYCYAVGFCEYSSYNSIYLNNTEAQLNSLLALPITNSSINQVAISTQNRANYWFAPIENAKLQAQFNSIITGVSNSYNGLVFNMSFISSRYSNALLTTQLSALQAVYNATVKAGINQNLTQANATLHSAITNASAIYRSTSSTYLKVYMTAFNDTALITKDELDYRVVPPYIISLGQKQAAINFQLNTQRLNLTQLSSVSNQLSVINSQALAIGAPFTVEGVTKALHAGLLDGMLGSVNAPIATKLSSAPLYSAGIALVIDLIIIGLIYYFTYHRLTKGGKINLTPKVHRTWMMIFALLVVLAVINTGVVWWYANNANTFIPIDGFLSSLDQSPAAYIIMNTSAAANPTVVQCAQSLKKEIASENESVYILNLTGTSACTLPTSAGYNALRAPASNPANIINVKGLNATPSATCLNKVYASGVPTIQLNTSINNTISYRGLYGNLLYVSGSSAQGTSCMIDVILRTIP